MEKAEDFEKISQLESLILQADQWEEEQRIIKEINEEEQRKPAIVTLIIEEKKHEPKDNPMALRRTD